jgi:hypothetical protein
MKSYQEFLQRCHPCRVGLVLALMLTLSPSAQAALGDDVSSVTTDQARMQAALQIWRKDKYDVHELAMPTGTKVRQFAASNGKVFAVTWSGGFRPNLRDVMGSHYDRFIAATRGKRRARGVVRIELPGMVVIMGGHQRALFGKVYLTDELPEGLTPEDIR